MNRSPYLVCVSPRNSCQRSPRSAWSLRDPIVRWEDRRRDSHGINTHHSILRNWCRESHACRDNSAYLVWFSILRRVGFGRSNRISAIKLVWELRQEWKARCPCFDSSRDWADPSRATYSCPGMRTWGPHDTSPQHHCGVHSIWRPWSRAPLRTVRLVNVFDEAFCSCFSLCFLASFPFYGYGSQMSDRLIWVVKKCILVLTCLRAFLLL
jgi:hypothetical protein